MLLYLSPSSTYLANHRSILGQLLMADLNEFAGEATSGGATSGIAGKHESD